MKNLRSIFRGLMMFAALAVLPASGHAASPSDDKLKQIPEALKPWETWATWNDNHRLCPAPYSDAGKHLCFWPSRFGLQAEKTGGKFDLVVTVFHETWVPLPGNQDVWPLDVHSSGGPLAIIEHEGKPAVRLTAGTFHLEGSYRWNEVPQRILIPREIGILTLVLDGAPVETPVWDSAGFLWLKRSSTTEDTEKNFLAVKLYSALEDGIPLWLYTEIELTVSGKSREKEIGTVLPEGWKLAAVDSPIPVAIDGAGQMKAQVRAGKWTVQVKAFRFDNPKEFHYAPGAKPAVAEQLVAFRALPDLRVVEITQTPSIDVSQTTFPEKWAGLPVYRWDTTTPFRLEERMRGMGDKKTAGLAIARELWLDEDGRGLTFRDHITGQMQQIWRLDAATGQDLGFVRIDRQGQLITRNPKDGAPGVEIRTRNLNLMAAGRMARTNHLSASGWNSDADAVKVTLNLPPGWRLLALFGADWVRGDWLTAWTLLDLFLLLIFSLAVFRLWGLWAGLLAFAAFGLSYHEPGAPRYLWLILLVPLALQRVIPDGTGRRVLGVFKWTAITLFVLALVPFVARQVQQALYPQLEVMSADGWADALGITVFQTESEAPDYSANPALTPADASNRATTINQKLDRIIIPKLEFREATIREAIDLLRKKSRELDVDSPEGERGITIVMKLDDGGGGMVPEAAPPGVPSIPGLDPVPTTSPAPPPAAPINPADARITVSLTNIPLREALKYVTGLANLKFKVEPYAVSIVPISENSEVLVTKEWKIPADLIPRTPGAAGALAAPAAGDADATRGGSGIADRESAKNWLTANGVTFNGQASALFIVRNNRLIVRNTQDQLDLIDTMVQTGGNAAGAPAATAFGGENLSYDGKARIQTGPGVPEWKWRNTSFGWNGPVSASQQVTAVLISLTVERILTALRVALTLALAAVLLGAWKLRAGTVRAGGKAAALAFFLFVTTHASAQTPIPDHSTLEKLRERLLETSDAYPHAADIPSVTLTLRERKVTIEATVHTAVRTAVPLPGRLPSWSPLTVLVDDKPEVAIRRDDGFLWLLIDAGVHHVHVDGSLANVSDWEWTYLLKPRQVIIDAPEWNFSGVNPAGVPEAQVFFTLQQKADAAAATYDRQEVQTVATVDRRIELGLIWQIHTTVTRLSALGKAAALRVPLLPGESVLSTAIVKDGFVEVRLGAQEQSFTWDSDLPVVNALKLATRAEDTWVERWHLFASPIWNVAISGPAPIFAADEPGLLPTWQPWPGESVDLTISRPEALAGATMTVDRVLHEMTLGRRQRISKLDLSLRCSLGEDFLVELPAGAEITALMNGNATIPVRKDGNKLVITVQPGEQLLSIAWKTNMALGVHAQTDAVRLPVESANLQTIIQVPEDRWVLWVDGPRRGPALRFWGILICSLLAALALGRVARSPLRTVEWMLLVIGLTQVPLPAALVVVAWLFAFVWRGSDTYQRRGNASYNTLQILLILLTVVALGILITAVGEGLLGSPEMFISGNGSTRTALRWFQARNENLLPRPGLLSISIWWYRFFMLAWALWLAASLIRWLRTGWQAFVSGGAFRSKPKRAKTPPPLPEASPEKN